MELNGISFSWKRLGINSAGLGGSSGQLFVTCHLPLPASWVTTEPELGDVGNSSGREVPALLALPLLSPVAPGVFRVFLPLELNSGFVHPGHISCEVENLCQILRDGCTGIVSPVWICWVFLGSQQQVTFLSEFILGRDKATGPEQRTKLPLCMTRRKGEPRGWLRAVCDITAPSLNTSLLLP